MGKFTTLGEHILQSQYAKENSTGELTHLLSCIRLAAKVVNSEINKAGLVDEIMGKMGKTNIQGEDQQKLDDYANRKFIDAFEARSQICGVASEEEDSYIAFEKESCRNGKYVVLIDPLDGSSNIDVNVSIGTIFSIYRRVTPIGEKAQLKDFLQKGTEIVAAGYVVYGSSTIMVLSVGQGVHGFTFDPSVGVFYLSHDNIQFPKSGSIYSVNEGNYPFFSEGIKSYLRYCKEHDDTTGRPLTSRYIGSMVSDFHRNMIKGGIYLYPSTTLAPQGKLRLLYECKPMAFLAEQAGGIATNGHKRILEIEPTELHQRCPFIVGSPDMVNKLKEFL
jgi:fructose-1,6-bisphosphatase I